VNSRLGRESPHMDEKFNKDTEILKKMEMLEIKNCINQIKITMESIINRLDQAEDRVSGIEDKVEEILYSESSKEKNKYT
jgi:DNA-binding ferritin-like protein